MDRGAAGDLDEGSLQQFPLLSLASPPPARPRSFTDEVTGHAVANASTSEASTSSLTVAELPRSGHHTWSHTGSSSVDFRAAPVPPPADRPKPALDTLPTELIEHIAAHACRITPLGPPKALPMLTLVSRRFHAILGVDNNDGFYADLFRERFDLQAPQRRWETMRDLERRRVQRKERRLRRDRAQSAASTSTSAPSSVSSVLSDLETQTQRQTGLGLHLNEDESPWRPLTSRDLAVEFRRRCAVLTRVRRAVLSGVIVPTKSLASTPTAHSDGDGARPRPLATSDHPRIEGHHHHGSHDPCPPPEALSDKAPTPDEVTLNLWTVYLMLMEHDTNNLPHLQEYAQLRGYMQLFYRHSLLSEALRPGWPRESIGGALGLWAGWLGAEDLSLESPEESDERFFVLKPYVFGAHKFDAYFQPWTIRHLPLSPAARETFCPPRLASDAETFRADLRTRERAHTIVHMGRRIAMAPPILAHAAIFSFFYRVEQDPAAAVDVAAATPLGAPAAAAVEGVAQGRGGAPRTVPPDLESRIHDADFVRLASVVNPYTRPSGLAPKCSRGMFAGAWEGRFSFFDFDSYREMLGGRLKSLYEGPFGDQPQVWRLDERVVRVRRGNTPGGRGSPLNAGYEAGEPFPGAPRPAQARSTTPAMAGSPPLGTMQLPDDPSTVLSTSPPPSSTSMRARHLSTASSTGSGASVGGAEFDEPGPSTRPGKKARAMSSAEGGDGDEHDDDDADASDEDYEILLTGSGHSAWGQFVLKGRIRTWDGMFSIAKEYTPDGRGRWLYRGYCIAGCLVGRWRDTHTPVEFSGYEGTFVMMRRQ